MSDAVAQKVREIVVKVLKVDPDRVRPEARFAADLGADSIQSVELVAAFAEGFDIDMREDEALAVQTVGDAVKFIRKCLDEQR
jgi:acyl carrier protein